MEGLKISLEGIDGVGKTTQLERITDHLDTQGLDVLVKPCRNNAESNALDNDLLQVLKKPTEIRRSPVAESLLTAARIAYIDDSVVNPHMQNGGIVVADRDIDTAVAYSLPGLEKRYPRTTPGRLIEWSLGLYSLDHAIPDLTLYLHAEPETALQRAMDDDNPNERAIFSDEDFSYMRLVQGGYQRLCSMFPDRLVLIDVNDMTISEVSEVVVSHVDGLLDRSGING